MSEAELVCGEREIPMPKGGKVGKHAVATRVEYPYKKGHGHVQDIP